MMPLEQCPEDLQALVRKFRATPAGRHALRCYAKHRFRPDAGNKQKMLVKSNHGRDAPLRGGMIAIMCCFALIVFAVMHLL
jgi:hypothetical protein